MIRKSLPETNGVLLIDVDGVLADFTHACLKLAAEKFNIYKTPEDITKGEIWDDIGCPELKYEISREVIRNEFCYRMNPIPEGITFLREIERRYGIDNVIVCTSPWRGDARQTATGKWADQRYDWLRDKAGVDRDRVIMAKRKFLIPGILIDDDVNNLEVRKPMSSFCIAHPYNKGFNGPRGDYAACLDWLTADWYNE